MKDFFNVQKNNIKGGRNRLLAVLLACTTLLSISYVMIRPAAAYEGQTFCGYDEHKHGESCYAYVKTCQYGGETDKMGESVMMCGLEESESVLICGMEEGHIHGEGCYAEKKELICDKHQHDVSCFDENGVLICTITGHVHSEDCYRAENKLICTDIGHTHSALCYALPEGGHVHTAACQHTHTEECFENKLICEAAEHEHTAECFSDRSKVEYPYIWEKDFAGMTLSGVWADDLVSIAMTQLGRTESTENFTIGEDGLKYGYTRYGDWYGDNYGDWCAMFISFCMHYAKIDSNYFPYEKNCDDWARKLADAGMFALAGAGYSVRKGDLVFFDKNYNGAAEHVGIVSAVDETTGKLTLIEGNLNDRVELHETDISDGSIFGFGILPENPDPTVYVIPESVMTEPDDTDENLSEEETEKNTPEDAGEIPEEEQEIDETDGNPENGEVGEDNEKEPQIIEEKIQQSNGEKLVNAAMSIKEAMENVSFESSIEGDIQALFVASCIENAELGGVIAHYESCAQWAMSLYEQGLLILRDSGYVPKAGDLVLFDRNGDMTADGIAIVTDSDSESGDLVTMEADAGAKPGYQFCKLSDGSIIGYYSIDGFISAESEAVEERDDAEGGEETEESVITAESEDGSVVTVTGILPENAEIKLSSVSEEMLAEIMEIVGSNIPLFAWDITIVDGEGNEWQPNELGVDVSITGLAIPENSETKVLHIHNEGEMLPVESVTEGNTVKFPVTGFSVFFGYSVGKDTETPEGGSELSFENGQLSAKLVVSPKLPENTELFVEKIDRAADPELWENMAAPVLRKLEEKFSDTEEDNEEYPEDGENADELVSIFSVKLTADGQELLLDESYDVRLEAKLTVPDADIRQLEENDCLSVYALDLEQAPPSNVPKQQTSEEPESENLIIDGEGTENTDITGADMLSAGLMRVNMMPASLGNDRLTSSETNDAAGTVGITSDSFVATELGISATEEPQSLDVKYSGDGRLRALTLYSYDLQKNDMSMLGAALGSRFNYTGGITHHKTIDRLGDVNNNNPDTDLDEDPLVAEAPNDYYRLYLDAGQYNILEPIDLLLVIDKSNSMIHESMMDVKDHNGNMNYRYVAIDEIMNGVDGKDGFVENFLKMNPKNQYAVVSFGGPRGMAGSDTVKSGKQLKNYSYTTDTRFETEGWENTYTPINCYPNDPKTGEAWGTNYSAALYSAQDMLAKSTSGNKQLMVFISDGVPTFWMENKNERYGNGGEEKEGTYNGSYDTKSYYIEEWNKKVTTKEQNITVTKARIDELKNKYPNLGIYAIGVASKEQLDTTLLNYMSTEGETGVYTSLDYQVLLDAFENILYGNKGAFTQLKIKDQLSKYVDIFNGNTDIKVTVTDNNVTKTLYEKALCTGSFTDTTTASGGYFTADNNNNGKPLLTSVIYDAETKTIEATFNPTLKLSKPAKYEMSFNVKITDTAKEEYEANLVAGKDAYDNVRGDADTDYAANISSSGKPGFHSNAIATATYKLGEETTEHIYDHPVVQTDGSIFNISVTKEWNEAITGKNREPVTVRLYSAAGDSKELTPVKNSSGTNVTLELKAENGWTADVRGLKLSDNDGNVLSYYIIEDTDKFLAVYTDPVYDMTKGGVPVTVAGKVRTSEASSTAGVLAGTATVTNNPRVLLPATGGCGDALPVSIGILLLGFGFILLYRKSRVKQY